MQLFQQTLDKDPQKTLGKIFNGTPPSDEQLDAAQRDYREVERLKQENIRIASTITAPIGGETRPPQKKRKSFFSIAILGTIAAIAGTVLLVRQLFAAGGTLLGLGVVILVAAIAIYFKDMVSREVSASTNGTPQMSEVDRQRIKTNEEQIKYLEDSLRTFLARYNCTRESISEQLGELQVALQQNNAKLAAWDRDKEQLGVLQQKNFDYKKWIEENLRQYFEAEIPDDAETILRVDKNEFLSLSQRQDRFDAQKSEVSAEIERLERDIAQFLEPFAGSVLSEEFQAQLTSLQRDSTQLRQNRSLIAKYEVEAERRNEVMDRCRNEIRQFSEKYSLHLDERSKAAALEIRDDVLAYRNHTAQQKRLQEEIEKFVGKNKSVLDTNAPQEQYDLDGLKRAGHQLDAQISALKEDVLSIEQSVKKLQARIDQIPQLEDDLTHWREESLSGQHNASLLDDTISFLSESKERLSSSYMGPVRQNFVSLMVRMAGEEPDNISVNPQLGIQLSRQGESRELPYFSAGQTDIIMLSMRLALVDALFKDTSPFIILDDPFVNLDDIHTAKAISLLKDLAKDHQVIYLVCNTSRTLDVCDD